MLAVSNSVSISQLLLVCGVLMALYGFRPGSGLRGLGRFALAGVGMLLVVLTTATPWLPTDGTYREARNHRLALTAARQADKEVPQATCLIVLDGSSVFTYGVEEDTLRKQFVAAGHRPCILSLAIAGGDHFERESMAEGVWQLMSEKTRQRAAALPTLWVKELHYSYDSQPGRMVADNADTARSLAVCSPVRSWRMATAMIGDWQAEKAHAEPGEGVDSPWPGLAVVLRHGMFNLFHAGYLQRIAEEEASIVRDDERLPGYAAPDWWDKRVLADEVFEHKDPLVVRPWFTGLLQRTPLGWPANTQRQTVLVIAPSLKKAEHTYAVQLARDGLQGVSCPLILGTHDMALRQQLDHKELWRDAVHLQKKGAEIATQWLAAKLLVELDKLKPKH